MYSIKNAISSANVPAWGNQKKYIVVHYLGVDGQGHDLAPDGCGAHFYIYWDGTIYQRCSLDAIPWAVGTAGYYTQKHPDARNSNCISIEMCCHNTGGDVQSSEDTHWWFTEETQMACVWLVQKLMNDLNIPLNHVLRHFDVVNKTCPNPYVLNNKFKTSWTWDEFKSKLSDSAEQLYRIRKAWKDEKSQIGAYASLTEARKACRSGYSVFDSSGREIFSSPKYNIGKRYRMNLNLSLRTAPSASAPFVMYKDIPIYKRPLFKKGAKGEALIKKGTKDKCFNEQRVGTRGIYMKLTRGWILAQLYGKDRVKEIK